MLKKKKKTEMITIIILFPLDNIPLYAHASAAIYASGNNDKQAAVPLTMVFVKPVYPLFFRDDDDDDNIICLIFFPRSALARDNRQR